MLVGKPPWERDRMEKKGSRNAIAPSSVPYDSDWLPPKEMTKEDIEKVIKAFTDAAKRAVEAGFDAIEVHGAHGYLINEFLSPLSNKRSDEYGGTLERRERFILEVVQSVRKVIPDSMPLFVRLSCVDHVEGGWTLGDSVHLTHRLKEEGCDVIDCSSGGIVEVSMEAYPGFQVPYAERIRREVGIRTMAVGLITAYEQAEEIVSNSRADLVAMAREFLRDPYLPIRWSKRAGLKPEVPRQYLRAWF